jgi:putative redox protein
MGTVIIRWVDRTLMLGTDSNGHSIVIGRSPENHDTFIGVKPSDLLLLSIASCTAYDVLEILSKQREPLKDLKVLCSGEQESEPPYTFTKIHLQYQVEGNVDKSKLERAIRLSEEKYCSVINTLQQGVPVSSDYEIQYE